MLFTQTVSFSNGAGSASGALGQLVKYQCGKKITLILKLGPKNIIGTMCIGLIGFKIKL
jgi:hypothetical protein